MHEKTSNVILIFLERGWLLLGCGMPPFVQQYVEVSHRKGREKASLNLHLDWGHPQAMPILPTLEPPRKNRTYPEKAASGPAALGALPGGAAAGAVTALGGGGLATFFGSEFRVAWGGFSVFFFVVRRSFGLSKLGRRPCGGAVQIGWGAAGKALCTYSEDWLESACSLPLPRAGRQSDTRWPFRKE